MRLPKLKLFDKIEVNWIDTVEKQGWFEREEAILWGEKDNVYCKSTGYYLGHNDKFLFYCRDIDEDHADGGHLVGGIQKHPLIVIIKVVKL